VLLLVLSYSAGSADARLGHRAENEPSDAAAIPAMPCCGCAVLS